MGGLIIIQNMNSQQSNQMADQASLPSSQVPLGQTRAGQKTASSLLTLACKGSVSKESSIQQSELNQNDSKGGPRNSNDQGEVSVAATTVSPLSMAQPNQFYPVKTDAQSLNQTANMNDENNSSYTLPKGRQRSRMAPINKSTDGYSSVGISYSNMTHKRATLKEKLFETMRVQNPIISEKPQFTKEEIVDLARMNEKRQMGTFLRRTQARNNHMKYLGGIMKTQSEVNSASRQKSRSGSRGSKLRLISATSGKRSQISQREPKLIHKQRTQRQSIQLFQSYTSSMSSRFLNSKKIQFKDQDKRIFPGNTRVGEVSQSMVIPHTLSQTGVAQAFQTEVQSINNVEDASSGHEIKAQKARQRIQSAQNFSRTMRARKRTQRNTGLSKTAHNNIQHKTSSAQIQTRVDKPADSLDTEARKVMENYGLIGQLYSQTGKHKGAALTNFNTSLQAEPEMSNIIAVSAKNSGLRIANTTYLTQATTTLTAPNKTITQQNGHESGNNSSEERGTNGISSLNLAFKKQRTPYQDFVGSSITENKGQILSNEMVIPGSTTQISNSILTNDLRLNSLPNSKWIRQASNQSRGNQEGDANQTMDINKSSSNVSNRLANQVRIDQSPLDDLRSNKVQSEPTIKFAENEDEDRLQKAKNQLVPNYQTQQTIDQPEVKFVGTRNPLHEIYDVAPTSAKKRPTAPYQQITGLKNKINDFLKQSAACSERIKEVDVKYKRVNTAIKELKDRTLNGTADKLEILRDLSTYEFNFAMEKFDTKDTNPNIAIQDEQVSTHTKKNFRSRIQDMISRIEGAKQRCKHQVKWDDDGKSYFTSSKNSFEFMNENYNHLLTQNRLTTSTYSSAGMLPGGSFFNGKLNQNSQPGLMHIKEERSESKSKSSAMAEEESQQFINVHQDGRRWLKQNEMEHLRGCLLQLVEIRRKKHTVQTDQEKEKIESQRRKMLKKDSGISIPSHPSTALVDETLALPAWQQAFKKKFTAMNQAFLSNNIWDEPIKYEEEKQTYKNKYDQTLEANSMISGISCKVVAYLLNGSINGQVTLPLTTDVFKFSMQPNLCRDWVSDVNLEDEIKRISFDYTMNEDLTQSFKLKVSNKKELQEIIQDQYFIIKIQGSKNMMNKVIVLIDDKSRRITVQVEHWNAKIGKNPDTKVPKKHLQPYYFEFSEFLEYLQDEFLSSPSLKIGRASSHSPSTSRKSEEDFIPSNFQLSQYVKVIENQMCLTTKANMDQALMFRCHAEGYYREIIYPQLLAKYLTTTEMDQSATMTKESPDIEKRRASHSGAPVLCNEMNIQTHPDELSPVESSRNEEEGEASISESVDMSASQPSPSQMIQEKKIASIKDSNVTISVSNLQPKSNSRSKNSNVKSPVSLSKNLQGKKSSTKQVQVASALSNVKQKMTQLSLNMPVNYRNHRSSLLVTGHGSLTKINQNTLFKTSFRKSEIALKQQLDGTLRQDSTQNDSLDNEGVIALKKLRNNKQAINQEILETEEDEDMARYEHLYGARLAKTHKKFNQHKQQQKINEDFQVEKDETEKQVIERIVQNHDSIIVNDKNRSQHLMNKPRRKYFRQPRIYQNNYVKELFVKGRVVDFKHEKESTQPKYEVIMLFFREHNQISLLLGRDRLEKTHKKTGQRFCKYMNQIEVFKTMSSMRKGSSYQVSLNLGEHGVATPQTIVSSAASDISDKVMNQIEKDDDSPFFLKIILDSTFLSLLENPNITEATEILGPPSKIDEMLANAIFQDIVNSEVQRMFYQPKQTKIISQPHQATNQLRRVMSSGKVTVPKLGINSPKQNSSNNISENRNLMGNLLTEEMDDYNNIFNKNYYGVINEEETSGGKSRDKSPSIAK